MTAPPRATFADRLRLARALIARGLPQPSVHLADQLGAAGREVRQLHDRLGAVLPLIEPGRHWRQRMDSEPSDETRAVLLAALLGCTSCCHLRQGGPQPAFVMLPLRRVDCSRCARTFRRPVTAEDECDMCGTPEVLTFYPFAVRLGPTIIAGDACADCAETLGIFQPAARAI